jgi:Peptidase propeptide and YPEB domain
MPPYAGSGWLQDRLPTMGGQDSGTNPEEQTVRKRLAVIGGAAVAAAVLVGGGVAVAGGFAPGEEGSQDYSQQQADRATEAALAATGGGKANSVERDGENGATWEVEVTKTDGTTVDVRLDEHYAVVVIEGDSESSQDESGD